MINSVLIIGYGEVGRAHFKVLVPNHHGLIFYKDKDKQIHGDLDLVYKPRKEYDLLIIATQCDPKNMCSFYDMVVEYANQFKPQYIDIVTTTPCGTCDKLQDLLPGVMITKSSVRGLHPHLAKSIQTFVKHIGGNASKDIAEFYNGAGIKTITHTNTGAVELAHILNNFIYGINILAADECAKYCREYGVDYSEFLKYRATQNKGFIDMGYESKVSPILYPLNGSAIGGHCVTYSVSTIPQDKRGPLAQMLYDYNKVK